MWIETPLGGFDLAALRKAEAPIAFKRPGFVEVQVSPYASVIVFPQPAIPAGVTDIELINATRELYVLTGILDTFSYMVSDGGQYAHWDDKDGKLEDSGLKMKLHEYETLQIKPLGRGRIGGYLHTRLQPHNFVAAFVRYDRPIEELKRAYAVPRKSTPADFSGMKIPKAILWGVTLKVEEKLNGLR